MEARGAPSGPLPGQPPKDGCKGAGQTRKGRKTAMRLPPRKCKPWTCMCGRAYAWAGTTCTRVWTFFLRVYFSYFTVPSTVANRV